MDVERATRDAAASEIGTAGLFYGANSGLNQFLKKSDKLPKFREWVTHHRRPVMSGNRIDEETGMFKRVDDYTKNYVTKQHNYLSGGTEVEP